MNHDLEDRAALIVVYVWCAAAIGFFAFWVFYGAAHP